MSNSNKMKVGGVGGKITKWQKWYYDKKGTLEKHKVTKGTNKQQQNDKKVL